MARIGINTGSAANDNTGSTLRAAGGIINDNFSEIYTYFGDGTNLTSIGGTWTSTSVGIHTLKNVGIGTTNPRFALEVGAVGTSGTTLFVNGDARVTGILTIGTASITLNGATNIINVGTGITINGSTGIISATSIVLGGTTLTGAAVTSITAGSGISVDQSTGNVTITATGGGGSSQWVTTAAGIHTLSNVGIGTTNPTSALTVKGNTSLETLNVTGVSTFGGNINVSDKNILFGLSAGSSDDRIVWGASSAEIYTNTTNLFLKTNLTSLNLQGEIISLSNYAGDEVLINASNGGSVDLYYNNSKKLETTGTGITVTGTIFTNQLNVSGVSTFTGDGTNSYQYFTSTNANLDFTSTFNVRKDGVTYISVGGNTAALSENTTVNGAYYRIRTLSTGAEINGNLGINTATPSSELHVVGNARVTGVVTATTLNVGTGGTVITTTTAGLVGIGTTNPTSALTVVGASGTTLLVTGGTIPIQIGGNGVSGTIFKVGGINLSGPDVSDVNATYFSNILYSKVGDFRYNLEFHSGGYTGYGGAAPAGGPGDFIFYKRNESYGRAERFRISGETGDITSQGGVIAASTNVSGISTLGTVQISSGIVTATSGIVTYYGDASYTTSGRWTLGADGTSNYTFVGIGFTQTTNDPILYLARGRVYEFVNNSGGGHPFEIRTSNGGAAYSNGVTNNAAASGVIRFEVPFNAPNTLYYQCTNHSGMGATIFVIPRNEPAVGVRTTVTATTSSIGAGATSNLNIDGFKTYSLLKVGISSAAWVVLYTDSTSRSNDASRSYLTDPTPGSGVIAEVRTISSGISTFIMSPGVIGWNNDVSVASTIYARVTNNESSTSSGIGVTLTVVKLED